MPEPTPQDREKVRFDHADIERAGALIYRNAALLRTSLVSDKTEAFAHDIADAFAAVRAEATAAERERCYREWDDVQTYDPCDGVCGSSCTPDGCHESHPVGFVGVSAIRRFNRPEDASAFCQEIASAVLRATVARRIQKIREGK